MSKPRIGHARIDENGKPYGGQPGDQGREVTTATWYPGGWLWMARCKDPVVADRSARAMEWICDNPLVGYNQKDRNSLREELRRHDWNPRCIDTPCNTDCSACVCAAIMAGGGGKNFPVGSANSPYTGNLANYLRGAGYEIFCDPKYLRAPDYLRRGDILCVVGNHSNHAVMVLDNGPLAFEDGKPVEPTPIKPAPVEPPKPVTPETVYCTVKLPLLKKHIPGRERANIAAVRMMQNLLQMHKFYPGNSGADGKFGPATERALKRFQSANGLDPDGQCGGETWKKLITGI